MKKISPNNYYKILLLLLATLFVLSKTNGQGIEHEGYPKFLKEFSGAVKADSILYLPCVQAVMPYFALQGRIYYSISDSSIYYSSGYNWIKIQSSVGVGTVINVGTSYPLTGGPITTTGTVGILKATKHVAGYLDTTDWQKFNNGWSLTGNSGTDPAINFIGTTDSQSLKFKVNNYQSGILDDVLFNTAFGWKGFQSNTTGTYNCFFGEKSGYSNTTGSGNGGLGGGASYSNTTGSHNNALGCKSLYLNQVGNYNVAVGDSTLFNNLNSSNIAVGSWALRDNTSGVANAGIGTSSLKLNKTGNGNVANGTSSGFSVNSDYNTLLGYFCGGGLKYGGYNTFIGAGLTTADSNTRKQIWFGTGDGIKRGYFDSLAWYFIGYNVHADTFFGKVALSEIYPAPSTGTVTSITAGTGLSGGTITTTGAISMPNVGTPGTVGGATQIPVITTDAQGRVSATTTASITPTTIYAGNGISVAGTTVTNTARFNLKFPYLIPGGLLFSGVTQKVEQDANITWDAPNGLSVLNTISANRINIAPTTAGVYIQVTDPLQGVIFQVDNANNGIVLGKRFQENQGFGSFFQRNVLNLYSGGTILTALGPSSATTLATFGLQISTDGGGTYPFMFTANKSLLINQTTDDGVSKLQLTGDIALSGVRGFPGQIIATTPSGSTAWAYPSITALKNTSTLDFPSTLAGTFSDLTVTITGAALGDVVTLGVPAGSEPTGTDEYGFRYFVSSANTVTVRFQNFNQLTAIDPPSGVFKIFVLK